MNDKKKGSPKADAMRRMREENAKRAEEQAAAKKPPPKAKLPKGKK